MIRWIWLVRRAVGTLRFKNRSPALQQSCSSLAAESRTSNRRPLAYIPVVLPDKALHLRVRLVSLAPGISTLDKTMCARPVWTAKIPGEPVGELPAEQHMPQWSFWCIERLLGALEIREAEPERPEAGGGRRETGCGPQRLVVMDDTADSLARPLTTLFLCSLGRLFQHLTLMARERLRTAAKPEFQEPGWERFVSLVMFESFMPCARRLDDRTWPASASASCICPFSCLVAALKETAK
ncbi:hypothetical protein B0T24DRAFT_261917 [Lasiosphaeria ovina]|uniref:Uncharacterized protein n=1 Tax=Lasiosphaeria ovina TaxID=92902 RepID=A0AAE0N7Z0_9PEZI|nr:hypothetical protein B0T24DRAFT_261917 [Lasiosphaeria ovina]